MRSSSEEEINMANERIQELLDAQDDLQRKLQEMQAAKKDADAKYVLCTRHMVSHHMVSVTTFIIPTPHAC